MKKSLISGFLVGALIFGTIGVFAYFDAAEATEKMYSTPKDASVNSFPVKLNGKDVNIEGYNIDGYTYFKLRDISEQVGGFSVDFYNDRILLAENNYEYDLTQEPFNSKPDFRVPKLMFKDDAFEVAYDWAHKNITIQYGNRLTMYQTHVYTMAQWNPEEADNTDVFIAYADEVDANGNVIRMIVMQIDRYTAEVSIIKENIY